MRTNVARLCIVALGPVEGLDMCVFQDCPTDVPDVQFPDVQYWTTTLHYATLLLFLIGHSDGMVQVYMSMIFM